MNTIPGVKYFQPFFVAAGLLCLAAPSFAGQWSVSYENEDTTGTQEWSEHTPGHSFDYIWDWRDNDGVQGFPGEFYGGFDFPVHGVGTGKGNITGVVRPIFTWYPSGANDLPPEHVSFIG